MAPVFEAVKGWNTDSERDRDRERGRETDRERENSHALRGYQHWDFHNSC